MYIVNNKYNNNIMISAAVVRGDGDRLLRDGFGQAVGGAVCFRPDDDADPVGGRSNRIDNAAAAAVRTRL